MSQLPKESAMAKPRSDTAVRLDRLIDTSSEAIVVVGSAGDVLHWSRGASRLFGVSAERAIGRLLRELDVCDGMLADVIDAAAGGEAVRREITCAIAGRGACRLELLAEPAVAEDAAGRMLFARELRPIDDQNISEMIGLSIDTSGDGPSRFGGLVRALRPNRTPLATTDQDSASAQSAKQPEPSWTDAEHARGRLLFLAEASRVLSSSLDYQATLVSIAQLAVPNVADWCAVDLCAADGRIERLAVAHVDPSKVEWGWDLYRRYPPDPNAATGVPHVIRSGTSAYYPEVTDALLVAAARDEEHLRILREVGFASAIVAPLRIADRTIGAITFVTSESGYHYTEADLALVEDLARRAAVAVENARLHRQVDEQRKRLNELLANVPGVVWEAWHHPEDPTQQVAFVSDFVEKMLGYTVDEWLAQPNFWLQIVHPDDRERAAGDAADIYAGRRDGFSQFRWVRKSGESIWVEARSSVIHDADGNPIGMRGVTMDLTERRRAAEALRLSEQRFQLVARATNDAIWDWDLRTDTVVWNSGLFAIAGYTDEDIDPSIGWWRERLHPEEVDRVYNGVMATIAGEDNFWADEYRFRRADGSYAYIYDRGYVIRNANGEGRRMLGAMIDISERKHAELALQQAKQEAEAANRAKDQFLAILSHELRTPLTPVLASAQVLETDPSLDADVREIITLIRRNVEIEARLIDDLLDLTRISRGKLQVKLSPVDVHAVLADVAELCRSELDEKCLTPELSLEAARHYVSGDETRLSQVFWNLVRNSAKFTDRDGAISIHSSNPTPAVLEIAVRDTGIGIVPELLERIFNPFEQGGEDVPRRFGGLGLGLAISRALIEAHNGTIHAESDGSGRGSAFIVRLPIEPPIEPPARR